MPTEYDQKYTIKIQIHYRCCPDSISEDLYDNVQRAIERGLLNDADQTAEINTMNFFVVEEDSLPAMEHIVCNNRPPTMED